jgi:formylglycine-generating enzyme required for sulfatase activity
MGRNIMERSGVLDRFLREIRAVAKLRHANIVTAYSAFRLGDSVVFAMEFVDGFDLAQLVKGQGPLLVSHACNFVYQAALGLQHAHEEGLVHRDIKPSNLMLAKKKNKATVRVLDFGLTKAIREEHVDSALTSQGQALGTPDFIAPEQIQDAPNADIRADIYSLGGTLYYLLTGRPPFKANSLHDLFQAHISRDADRLNLVRPEVPSELAAVVAKMMAKDPARRFQTPGEVAAALAPFFKTGSAAFMSPRTDLSQAGQTDASRPRAGPISTPTQPATGVGGTDVRANKGAEPTVPEARWGTLIDFREKDPEIKPDHPKPRPAMESGGRPPWFRPVVAAAAGFTAILFGIIIYITIEKNRVTVDVRKTETPSPKSKPSDTARPDPSLKTWANSLGMKFVRIEPGKFIMGSTENADEKPYHLVEIARPFSLGDREVTQRQYMDVMGVNPSYFKGSDDLPVEMVSWLDAVTFCTKLSEKEGRTPCYRINGEEVTVVDGNGYRLPTEAEWEYACRAGSTTRYPFGDNESDLGESAWFDGNADRKTHPVGQKRPNRWGLYDMLGNVWEWCQDGYDAGYYAKSPTTDPPGPSGASTRVTRGGSWIYDPANCRPAFRFRGAPEARDRDLGFRLAAVRAE